MTMDRAWRRELLLAIRQVRRTRRSYTSRYRAKGRWAR